jgi:hypothetical protein
MSQLHTAAEALVNECAAHSGALIVTPHGAMSYQAEIARRIDSCTVWLTTEKYSVTTSKHTNALRTALHQNGYRHTSDEQGGWEVWTY